MLETASEFPHHLFGYIMHAGARIWPMYLIITVLICFAIFQRSNARGTFLGWLFPKSIYLHRSNLVDINLFVVGRIMAFVGVLKSVTLTTLTATFVMALIDGSGEKHTSWNPFLVGLILVMAQDFGVYWVHRLHHETGPLWPFHSVHHSAEVMTPVTVYRKHPVYDLISTFSRGILGGLVQGILLGLFVGNVGVATIAGANAIYVLFNVLGANLRHSHIWLSYGRVLEHILISPAQHQIHHSRATKHWNKNYGEVFALWDLVFGTLYVPKGREEIEFGLADVNGVAVEQPHNTLAQALLVPFRDSWLSLKRLVDGKSKPRTVDTD